MVAGLHDGLPRLSTTLSPVVGDIAARPRGDVIHRGMAAAPLRKNRPDRPRPHRAWGAALDPRAIHSFIPGLCAQPIDIAGFLSDAPKPSARLARSGHPPACPQPHPQLPGISQPPAAGGRKFGQTAPGHAHSGLQPIIPRLSTDPSPAFVHKPGPLPVFCTKGCSPRAAWPATSAPQPAHRLIHSFRGYPHAVRRWMKFAQPAAGQAAPGPAGLIPIPPTEPSPLFVHKPLNMRVF
jgi:hypothetical protein